MLAPHTDDGELGCGGTISYLVGSGIEVHYAAFSACEQSVLKEFPKDILITEVKEATKTLGLLDINVHLYKYNVRTFNYYRQDILEDLISLREKIKPELVFMPSLNDIHQDHATISNEAVRAFKFSSILCYELPWNNFNFQTSCFVKLTNTHIDTKIAALSKYQSQKHKSYANAEFIKSLARIRGVQINSHFAEAFEVIRWII